MAIVLTVIALFIVLYLLNKLFNTDANPRSKAMREIAHHYSLDYRKVGHISDLNLSDLPLFLQAGQYHHGQHMGHGDIHDQDVLFFDYALFSGPQHGKPFTVFGIKWNQHQPIGLRRTPKGTFRQLDLKPTLPEWTTLDWLGSEWGEPETWLHREPVETSWFNDHTQALLDRYPGLVIELLHDRLWIYGIGQLLAIDSFESELEFLVEWKRKFETRL